MLAISHGSLPPVQVRASSRRFASWRESLFDKTKTIEKSYTQVHLLMAPRLLDLVQWIHTVDRDPSPGRFSAFSASVVKSTICVGERQGALGCSGEHVDVVVQPQPTASDRKNPNLNPS